MLVVTEAEWEAALRIFPTARKLDGSSYYVVGEHTNRDFDIVLKKIADRGNVPTSTAATNMMEDYRPSFLFLFGTAGGITRDGVKLGDVVVANHIGYSGFKKVQPANGEVGAQYRYRPTPLDHPSLRLREDYAVPRCRDNPTWKTQIFAARPDTNTLAAHEGQILAGESILADPDAEEQRAAMRHFDKALAVETESFGLAQACFSQRRATDYNPLYLEHVS